MVENYMVNDTYEVKIFYVNISYANKEIWSYSIHERGKELIFETPFYALNKAKDSIKEKLVYFEQLKRGEL